MSKLIKEIAVPKEVSKSENFCPTSIFLYDDYVYFEGKRAQSYFFKDFTGVSIQKASIFTSFASLIFLNPVSANNTWKNSETILTDRNRVLFYSGTFSYGKANEYVENLAEIIRNALENYKQEDNSSGQSVDAVDEIKKYKELLDSGIITQEEFDSKKKQLLNL